MNVKNLPTIVSGIAIEAEMKLRVSDDVDHLHKLLRGYRENYWDFWYSKLFKEMKRQAERGCFVHEITQLPEGLEKPDLNTFEIFEEFQHLLEAKKYHTHLQKNPLKLEIMFHPCVSRDEILGNRRPTFGF